ARRAVVSASRLRKSLLPTRGWYEASRAADRWLRHLCTPSSGESTPRHICHGVGSRSFENTAHTPPTDVVVLFAALWFATARPLRRLGVVQRIALWSSVSVAGWVV